MKGFITILWSHQWESINQEEPDDQDDEHNNLEFRSNHSDVFWKRKGSWMMTKE